MMDLKKIFFSLDDASADLSEDKDSLRNPSMADIMLVLEGEFFVTIAINCDGRD